MKATGVIRRIDELGRIVIPKEIRKNLRIKEGENLETGKSRSSSPESVRSFPNSSEKSFS